MTYYNMMNHGYKIRIEAGKNKGFAPSEFWTEQGNIYCKCSLLGDRARRDDLDAGKINRHIDRMIKEGFAVTIRMA